MQANRWVHYWAELEAHLGGTNGRKSTVDSRVELRWGNINKNEAGVGGAIAYIGRKPKLNGVAI